MQSQFETLMLEIQEDMSKDITLSNSLILFKKGWYTKSHFEAAESYNKAIILLQYILFVNRDGINRKNNNNRIVQLMELCQTQLSRLILTPYILNDSNKLTMTESLEQVQHIDHVEEKVLFLVKKWSIILIKGGLITQHIKFHPKYWQNNQIEQKEKTFLFKNVVSSIEKLIVLYKFTPEAELRYLSEIMKDELIHIYKDYQNKKYILNEELLYWIQVYFKSSASLIDLMQERTGKIDQQTRIFIFKILQKLNEIYQIQYQQNQQMSYNNEQQANLPGKFISQNLRPLAAVKILVQTNQESIIYPIRKPTVQVEQNGKVVQRKGELILDPVNHDNGSPKCTISLSSWQNGNCSTCQKNIPNNQWYFDVTLSIIASQYQNKPNSKDIIECIKFYRDGEFEILYTQFDEALKTEMYIENDPIMTALLQVQSVIVQQASTRENVILEQNPEMIEKFKEIINEALK